MKITCKLLFLFFLCQITNANQLRYPLMPTYLTCDTFPWDWIAPEGQENFSFQLTDDINWSYLQQFHFQAYRPLNSSGAGIRSNSDRDCIPEAIGTPCCDLRNHTNFPNNWGSVWSKLDQTISSLNSTKSTAEMLTQSIHSWNQMVDSPYRHHCFVLMDLNKADLYKKLVQDGGGVTINDTLPTEFCPIADLCESKRIENYPQHPIPILDKLPSPPHKDDCESLSEYAARVQQFMSDKSPDWITIPYVSFCAIEPNTQCNSRLAVLNKENFNNLLKYLSNNDSQPEGMAVMFANNIAEKQDSCLLEKFANFANTMIPQLSAAQGRLTQLIQGGRPTCN